MTIELADYISELNEANPEAASLLKEVDDHVRLLKSVLKTSFPAITSQVVATSAELNLLSGVSALPTVESVYAPVTLNAATHDFANIPANTREILIGFNGASVTTSGNAPLVQLGTSGPTFVTTGYLATAGTITSGGAAVLATTNGFCGGPSSVQTGVWDGFMRLTHGGGNVWFVTGAFRNVQTGTNVTLPSGMLALGGLLTDLRVTTRGGAGYDAGTCYVIARRS